MFGKANGILFGFLIFVTSSLGSIFIILPFFPFAIWRPKIFRWIADRCVGYWLTFPASMIEFVFGCRFHVTGDLIERDKPAIIIMNHRTRLDWLFLWNALYKMDPWLLTTEKISLKAGLKRIPGAGWAMSCGAYTFLERNFQLDQQNMAKMIQYYKDSGQSYQILLFPEGTDRDIKSTARSHEFAERNGLPPYDYTLHPRTTGFNYLIKLMKKADYISCVYDVTVGYADKIVQSEHVMLKDGLFPGNIHFDVKKYDIEGVPESEEDASKWLNKIWADKEARLKRFYTETSKLEPSGERFVWPVETRGFGYVITCMWWFFSSFMWIYFTYEYLLVKIYIVIGICFYVWTLKAHNGAEFLIMKWFYEAERSEDKEKVKNS